LARKSRAAAQTGRRREEGRGKDKALRSNLSSFDLLTDIYELYILKTSIRVPNV
jgi:hypothetical protein